VNPISSTHAECTNSACGAMNHAEGPYWDHCFNHDDGEWYDCEYCNDRRFEEMAEAREEWEREK